MSTLVKKNKTLVVQYNFLGGMSSKYANYVIVKSLEDFDMLEEKNRSGLNGKPFVDDLAHRGLVKFVKYLKTGVGGAGNCQISEVSDEKTR